MLGNIIKIIGGFLMALADSVPGVSGGSIAFIMGFYDEFIDSLSNLFHGTNEQRKKALMFLFVVAMGWIFGMVIAVTLLSKFLDVRIYDLSSLFIGFIAASIPIIIYEELKVIKGKYYNLIWTVVGIAFVVGIQVLNSKVGIGDGQFKLGVLSGIYLFVVAAFAICAMVLPGISGSTILLIFGLYEVVINAVHGVMHMELNKNFLICVVFGLGVLTGVASIIGALKNLLKKHRSPTVYAILGLMLGSFYAIVEGPTTLKENPKPAMSFDSFSIMFFVLGVAIVLGLQYGKIVINKKINKDLPVAD